MEELTPQERILQAEGNAMLAQIAGQKQQTSTLVDASGNPFVSENKETAPQEVDPREEMRKFYEQAEKRQLASIRKISEIFAKEQKTVNGKPVSGALENVCEVIATAHRLIFWANMEMASHEDVTDEMITDYGRYVHGAVYRDTKGFDIREVFAEVKYKVTPLVRDYISKYEDAARVRKMKMEQHKKILGPNGITVPEEIKAKVKTFVPGRMFVLNGAKNAVHAVMLNITKTYEQQTKAPAAMLCTTDTPSDASYQIPLAKWNNSAMSMHSLYEALDPVVQSDKLLLMVPDISELYTTDNLDLTKDERRAFTIKRLYQWAIENMVAVVVGDVSDEAQDYGFIPSFKVSLNDNKLEIS